MIIKVKLSILTATYNRAKYLTKLYESIKINLNCNIVPEWIIVDDGSSDNTKEIIQSFLKENKFEIKYFYQENKGKMLAINKAVEIATGELIVDCDSDDYFTTNSFKIIENNANKILNINKYYGLVFLKKEEDGNISGKEFKNENSTTMFDLYFKDDIEGEKVIVYNSAIRREYKHETEQNEKFITEARMYHKMDEMYKLIPVNEAIQQGSYIDDGYTKNINKIFKENPYGYYMYFKEIMQKNMQGVILKKRLYAIKHFVLFSYLTNNSFNIKIIKDKINKLLYCILYIPGVIKSKRLL